MSEAWGTGAMSEALPAAKEADVSLNTEQNTPVQNGDAQPEPPKGYDASRGRWTEPQAIDYTSMAAGNDAQTWGCNARAYAWQDEYGDVGPKYPELELELFGEPHTRHERTGLDFSR
jgi:ATP-dependent RNA helicase DDX3X